MAFNFKKSVPRSEHLGLNIFPKGSNSTDSERGGVGRTNIIFVHGLGGEAMDTWSYGRSKIFWPGWLPNVPGLEQVRVMTFGYNADWARIWKSNNVLDLSDFALQLPTASSLPALCEFRGCTDCVRRT